MRFGRIILALLAPLISVSPSLLKADAPAERKQAGADALIDFWGTAFWCTPLAASQVDADLHASANAGSHASGTFILAPSALDNGVKLALPSIQTAAALRLISRQHFHFSLRC